jgi:hypothetical protein
VSELERMMSILRQVTERPEAREEFRIEIYLMHEKDLELYEQTMADLEKLQSTLHHETRDFVYNILEVRNFLKRVEEYKASAE